MAMYQSRFDALGTDFAPGQEVRQAAAARTTFRGERLEGRVVDFSHGDVDAFEPIPGSFEAFEEGYREGGAQAYTEYRGRADLREHLADKLTRFVGTAVSADHMIVTPGSQGALFLAMAAAVSPGDKVAIVQPDYFANRKIVAFLGGTLVPVKVDYLRTTDGAGLDLSQLEDAFRGGVKVFLFSNPNNPAGVVYSESEIGSITELARRYGATVIVDQLYSRLLYSGERYTHLCATMPESDNVITLMGPSKTESLSGFRLGVAFGSPALVERMEKLQAIVSLRAAGYSQAVLRRWMAEPVGWMEERIRLHQAIHDDLLAVFGRAEGIDVRPSQAGSYLFPQLPALDVSEAEFVTALRVHAGVIVTPGSEFGPHSSRSIRLNFSQDHAASVAAAERIVAMVERYRA